jgi:hypothetical protein
MNNKSSNAIRGNVVTLLYEARGMKGVNEVPTASYQTAEEIDKSLSWQKNDFED